jgi:dolichol kinase
MPDGISDSDKSYISWKGELVRKGIHLCSLLIPTAYFIFNPTAIVAGLSIAVAFSAIFDLLRFFGHNAVKKYLGLIFGFIMRPREKKSFSGSTTILFAALLVYLFYDLPIAAAAMVIVVVGDTAAAFVGRLVGKIRLINSKSLEGTLAFIMFALVGMLLIPDLDFEISVVGVLVGALFELLPIPIDDNVSVPIMAGGAMQILFTYHLFI